MERVPGRETAPGFCLMRPRDSKLCATRKLACSVHGVAGLIQTIVIGRPDDRRGARGHRQGGHEGRAPMVGYCKFIVLYNNPTLILQANFVARDQEQWWWEGERVARSFIDCGAPLLSNRSGEVVEAALTTEISLRPSEAMS